MNKLILSIVLFAAVVLGYKYFIRYLYIHFGGNPEKDNIIADILSKHDDDDEMY